MGVEYFPKVKSRVLSWGNWGRRFLVKPLELNLGKKGSTHQQAERKRKGMQRRPRLKEEDNSFKKVISQADSQTSTH